MAASPDLIYTYYEGGDFLAKAFEATKMLLYGDAETVLNQTFTALLRIALTVGAFCCIAMAFFRQSFNAFIRNFFVCSITVVPLLLVPTTRVQIVDFNGLPLGKETEIQAPFFLGKFASWTSRSIHHLHHLFTSKETYPWIRNISSGENLFRPGRFTVSSQLEGDFKEFCRECVFCDLGVGLYTKQELSGASHLLEFFKEGRASRNQTIYSSFDGKNLPCNIAIEKMYDRFNTELETEKNEDWPRLFGVEGTKEETQKFIGQRIAIDCLKEALEGSSARVEGNQFFGASALLAMGGFFEAVIYLSFPLVILLSLLSFGIRMMVHWVKLVLWISLWPVFFPIIDLFLQSLWNHRKGGLPYTLAHADRFSGLYHSMETLAAIALFSIPILSWLLIKGTLNQVVHIASSLAEVPSVEVTTQQVPQEAPQARYSEAEVAKQEYCGVEASQSTHLSSENAFEEGVKAAQEEDRDFALRRSVSSIEAAVKDSGDQISKSVKNAAYDMSSSQEVAAETIVQNHEAMIIPSESSAPVHGSWAEFGEPRNE